MSDKEQCVRCGGPLTFRRDCHQCGEPLCDHVCEEWHLEKDCKGGASAPAPVPASVHIDGDTTADMRVQISVPASGAREQAKAEDVGYWRCYGQAVSHYEKSTGRKWQSDGSESYVGKVMDDYAAAQTAAQLKSMTYGDLVKVLPTPGIEPHEWDNKNISEQRDWAIQQTAALREERDVAKSAYGLSQAALKLAQQRAEAAESRAVALETALREERSKVLQECADIADGARGDNNDPYDNGGWDSACGEIESRIRALLSPSAPGEEKE